MTAFIEAQGLVFNYPQQTGGPIPALRGIDLHIEAGEYVAIIGANGSGKSTLARHFNALHLPTSGQVHVAGMDTRDHRHHAQIRLNVGMVLQFPEDQIVATLVEEDVAFGPENMGLPPAEIRQRVEAALKSVGMWDQRDRPPYLLSAGQIQRVALAGALAMRPRCIVFDEATAMLDPQGRQAVLEQMDALNRQGMTVIAITHFMADAVRAGRVVALHQGQVALQGTPAQVFAQTGALREIGLDLPPAAQVADLLRTRVPGFPAGLLQVEELVSQAPPYPHPTAGTSDEPQTEAESIQAGKKPLIEVDGLGHIYMAGTPLAQRALQDASFYVQENSTHGLLGATGSGKSTLLQHLNGLLIPQEGKVRVGIFDLNDPQVDVRQLRRQVGLVNQIPESQFFEQYVGDEIAFGPRQLGTPETVRADVQWAMEMVGLDFDQFRDRLIYTLSGGERRKVALASLLAIKPDILLLDEPMAGLDPASRADLIAKFKAFETSGMTLVLSSHYMDDVSALVDQVTVFSAGTNALTGTVEQVFSQVDQLHTLGLELPVVTQIAEGLRQRGWPLPPGITSAHVLAETMERLLRAQTA